ncbi:SLC45 family MFS transporter [Psychroflexus gondwanensis]|jgi:maltose/moltooligosaccharide transporter|uniref:Maltose transporter MalT-like, MFS superfamily protein n=1 Tax=Psychroflexus gondwanensis ACAM 44 TaxID=1189619 RepID=N1X320_9FLAO|nr:MFS transporter [Psychroflexus gondwanensis]EMY82443.1 maltose transporter MalT-like, MFS superfamily protein [Psychroflexus gondwanensis ACAM 44]TXE18935.1 SLC45 family MFS transporter [Psychroflexus gondwanensis]
MQKRKLSFWEIWNMSFGFLGIQFGFALQNANTSRIFETLGADVEDIPILWIAAPVTGLVVQPIVGYLSDKTWTRLGRRKPYFLVGAILASIALFLMPNSPELWIAAGMLWIMDASINISMEPFRAFVGDNLPEEQRTLGFAMQSFFIGIGAVVGSALPYVLTNWMGIDNTAPAGEIPDSVKWSFYVGGVVFFLAVLWTVLFSKEYSPEEMEAFEKESAAITIEPKTEQEIRKNITTQQKSGSIMILVGAIVSYLIYANALTKELYILFIGLIIVGVLFLIVSELRKKSVRNGFTIIVSDLLNMPKTMKQLAWVQFFSWFALFSMWIYTTQAVTGHVFDTRDTTSKLYNDAADWVTVMFTVYNGVAALVAFALPVLAKKTSNKFTHMLALILGGLGLISIYFMTTKTGLIISMVGVGIAWASILSIPYAMLSGSLPSSKMGYYMGVFNFFIVIPQIVASTILGFIVSNLFDNQPVYALIIGGIAMIAAGLFTLKVTTNSRIDINQNND